MKVSGCYIVKNEENNIVRSINSIKNLCDEIIVVDTGSQDHTVAVAKEAGAKILFFKWVDDFAKARNFALKNVTGDIIIFLDADEWFPIPLDESDRDLFAQILKDGNTVYSVPFCDYDGKQLSPPMRINRVFRNFSGLRYINPIHETLNDVTKVGVLPDRFTLYHTGYDKSIHSKKIERNLDLLYTELKKNQSPGFRTIYSFYIARESSIIGKTDDALKYLELFFERWRALYDKWKIANMAIAAYQLRCSYSVAQSYKKVPDEKCRTNVEEFVLDFPKHPTARYCEADFNYHRTGDYIKALKAIKKMEELQEQYNPKDYPNDMTSIERFMPAAMGIKGLINYDFKNFETSFDSLVFIIQKAKMIPDIIRKLLILVKSQPQKDIIAFMNSLKADLDEHELEAYLSQLLFFPELKDVYLYYATSHIKLTKKHSDISAIAALFGDPTYDHIIKIAMQTMETDFVSADTLLLTVLFCAEDESVFSLLPQNERLEHIFDFYKRNAPITESTLHEMCVLSRAMQILLFIDKEYAIRRAMDFFENYKYERFLIQYNFYFKAEKYAKILDCLDFDIDTLDTFQAANTYFALAEVELYSGLFDQALYHYDRSLQLSCKNEKIFRSLNILASLSPKLAEPAERLRSMYLDLFHISLQEDTPLDAETDSSTDVIDAVFNPKQSAAQFADSINQ